MNIYKEIFIKIIYLLKHLCSERLCPNPIFFVYILGFIHQAGNYLIILKLQYKFFWNLLFNGIILHSIQ